MPGFKFYREVTIEEINGLVEYKPKLDKSKKLKKEKKIDKRKIKDKEVI